MPTRRQVLGASAAIATSAALPAAGQPTMLTREIPSSGEALPIVGLGTYAVFDVAGSAQEIANCRAIVDALFLAGGRVIDSSPMYNRSESITGRVLALDERNEAAFIATKVWTDGRSAGKAQIQQSAERMQSPVIDLMQVHNRRDMDSHWPTIEALRQAGLIRYTGITDYRESAHDAMAALMRRHQPDFIQINYSLGETGAADTVLPLAQELGIAVLVNRPYMAGRLFRAVRGKTLPEWSQPFAQSWGQFFLKFILGHTAVTCVIPATSKVSHMRDNALAGVGSLPDAKTRQRMQDWLRTL